VNGGRLLLPKGTTKANAEQEFAKRLQEAAATAGNPVTLQPETPLTDYTERFFANCTEITPRTLAGYRQVWTCYVLSKCEQGESVNRALTRSRVKTLLASLRAPSEKRPQGYSKDTVRLVRTVGSMLCEDAIEDGLLNENPFLLRKSRRKQAGQLTWRDRTQKVRAMTDEQLARFHAGAEEHEPDPNYRVFWLVGERTGPRPGEGIAAQATDIDWQARTLRIERALSHGRLGPTKTGEERTVDLSPEVIAALRKLLAYNAHRALAEGSAVPPWIFCTSTGTPLDESQLRKRFARVLKKAGLPHFRLYDLRHTFATRLLNRGVPITYVAAQLGHKKPTTTLQWYAHALPTATARYVDQLDDRSERGASPPMAPNGTNAPNTTTSQSPLTVDAIEEFLSGPRENRTPNPLIKSQLLCQLS
jgi:integrase